MNLIKVELIVLIDDSTLDMFIIRKVIEKLGYRGKFIEFSCSMEAVDFMFNCTFENFPDLIFLDLNMPHINGYEFLNRYQNLCNEMKEKCKVLVVSSSIDER